MRHRRNNSKFKNPIALAIHSPLRRGGGSHRRWRGGGAVTSLCHSLPSRRGGVCREAARGWGFNFFTNMKNILTAGLYFVAFMLIQIIVQGSAALLCKQMSVTMSSTALVLTSIIGGAITIGVFAWRRWSPFSREYMQQRRWDVFVWTALMALGIVAPMQLIIDLSGLEMPVTAQQLFTQLLSNQWGFLAVAVVVPLAEEMAFRGAILRTLLDHFGPSGRWWAILLSALLFGMAHGNTVQFVNGTVVGLLLGWLYWRTRSIAPGVVFHLVNNAIAFFTFRFMPGLQNMKLTDFFGGDYARLALFILCSLCVLVPAWWQVKRLTDR